jgi:prepilin-type N-terminal cleavage/methylation domain-containing protein
MKTLYLKDKKCVRWGFTLFELIVVLVIISAMMTVTIPYARRSNESLKAREECLNMTESIKYAINTAINKGKTTRLMIDMKNNSYTLQIETKSDGESFEPIQGFHGAVCYLSRTVRIVDMQGFETVGNNNYLEFNPRKKFSNASLSLSDNDLIRTIRICGKHVEIEEPTLQE